MSSVLDLTKELISFRSSHQHRDTIWSVTDFVERYFKDTPLTIERFVSKEIPSILITKGTKTPRILLCGHLDVIDGTSDQFNAREDGGKLFGRGAIDMKSGNAVLMELMREHASTPHDVGLLLTGDEEVGGFDGVNHVLAQGIHPSIAIIPDGGYAPNRIVEKAKGILWLELEARGRSAHGSRPWEGHSAIEILMTTLHDIKKLFMPSADHPAHRWITTCNIGKIQGGHTTNQVATEASASLDIRYTEDMRPDDIIRMVQSLLPEGVIVHVRFNEPMTLVDHAHPLVSAYEHIVTSHGLTVEKALDHGSSDARFFSAHGIPSLICQPLGGNMHAPGEWVDIQSVETYKELLRKYLDLVAQ